MSGFQIGRLGVLVAVLLGTVTGCGATPNRPAIKKTSIAAAPLPAPAGTVVTGADGRDLASRMVARVNGLPAYKLAMRWRQKSPMKTTAGLYEITGKAPRTTLIDIKEGVSQGTRVLFTGGATAKVRPTGVLSAFTANLDLNDDRLLSVRGYNLAQTDMKALMDMASDPRGQVTIEATSPTQVALAITGPQLLPGCKLMRLTLDPATFLPLDIDQLDAREVVYHLEIRNFRALKDTAVAL